MILKRLAEECSGALLHSSLLVLTQGWNNLDHRPITLAWVIFQGYGDRLVLHVNSNCGIEMEKTHE